MNNEIMNEESLARHLLEEANIDTYDLLKKENMSITLRLPLRTAAVLQAVAEEAGISRNLAAQILIDIASQQHPLISMILEDREVD